MEKPKIIKQSVMFRVLYATLPVSVAAIYFFGWRIAVIMLVSCFTAFTTEWLMVSQRNGKITTACFVTAVLYSLSLPPTIPLWVAAVGAIVAILFGKEVFGGFGRNVFNPAIVGRAFIYVCFPIEMTSRFVPTFTGFPGGFTRWDFTSISKMPHHLSHGGLEIIDAVSSATPLLAMKQFGVVTNLTNLITGNIGQIFDKTGSQHYVLAAGSCGEVCSLAILLSLAYLLYTKTIQHRLFFGTIIGAVLLNSILIGLSKYGAAEAPPISFTLFSGALLYAAVFMVTEPITAPKNKNSQWGYAIFIGMMIVLFRCKAVFAGGVAFSILLGNMLAPSLDILHNKYRQIREESS